jgi:hypothetical protein
MKLLYTFIIGLCEFAALAVNAIATSFVALCWLAWLTLIRFIAAPMIRKIFPKPQTKTSVSQHSNN